MDLPTATDINVCDSLDERLAVKVFLGKTIPEAEDIFHDNSMSASEALIHMGPKASLYYLQALVNYLASPRSQGNEWAAQALPHVVELLMESGVQFGSLRDDIVNALTRIHAQFPRYAPDRTTQRIYRNVPKDARRMIVALGRREHT